MRPKAVNRDDVLLLPTLYPEHLRAAFKDPKGALIKGRQRAARNGATAHVYPLHVLKTCY